VAAVVDAGDSVAAEMTEADIRAPVENRAGSLHHFLSGLSYRFRY
jgi:hypothetical protein